MLFSAFLMLQSAALPTLDEVKLRDCLKLVRADAKSGIVAANEWAQSPGGAKNGYFADICLASGYAADGKYAESADSFARAAKLAEKADDPAFGKLWAQAGGAALSAGRTGDALEYIETALRSGKLLPDERTDTLIDRARAHVASERPDSALADLAEIRRTAPNLGQGWLLSATLARRMGDLAAAQGFIKTAAALYDSDPAVALEAGNIAAAAGAYDIAREQWQQTIKIAPGSPQSAAARGFLDQLAAIEADQAKIANAAKAEAAAREPQTR